MRTAAKTDWYASVQISLPDNSLALVLAGGKGSRLRASEDPKLRETPKVLVSIEGQGGRTAMLGHSLAELYRCGFPQIAVLTSADPDAKGSAVEAYALAQQRLDRRLRIYREPYPLGTAGSVYAALVHNDADVAVVIPADTLFPHSALPSAVAAHINSGHDVTWAVTTQPGPDAQNPGKLLVDPVDSRLVHALEGTEVDHPSPESDGLSPATSAGVVIATRSRYQELFESYVGWLGEPRMADLYRQFIPWLLSRDVPVGVFDIRQSAPDLGTPERLRSFGRLARTEQ